MIIQFAPWRPDQYNFNAALAGEASGVLPGPNSYHPWPGLTAYSTELPSVCRGAFLARTAGGAYKVFAGTASKLYMSDGSTGWTDVTRVSGGDYTVATDERWTFCQFGTNLLAANANDVIQTIDIDAGSAFTALGGNPPQGRYLATVGDQVFIGGLLTYPNRIAWSGRNDSTFWTFGERDSDYQDFPDGGFVTGLTSIETGLIFQKGTIRRFVPVNTRAIFNFARVEDSRGLIAPASLVVVSNRAYYLSEDGFFVTDGSGASKAIGADVVDRWFQADINYSRVATVIGAADPTHQRVFWLYPSAGNDGYIFDRCLCYDFVQDKWTHGTFDASHIFGAASVGVTMVGLDLFLDSLGYTLDTAPFSLDARWLLGGAPYLAGFDSSFRLAFFTGPNLAATIETGDFQAIPNRRAFVRGVRPLTDSASATVMIGAKERPQDSLAYGSAIPITAQGNCPARSSGRIHRVRTAIAAGVSWSHLQGVDVDAVQDGQR